jgi:hypothetical protein
MVVVAPVTTLELTVKVITAAMAPADVRLRRH